jgi:hypothetical protein
LRNRNSSALGARAGSGLGPSDREVRLSKLNEVLEDNRERLIRVFTYYCSFGEPLNTNTMRSAKFIKFLKDSRLLEGNLPKSGSKAHGRSALASPQKQNNLLD